ncbi:MAG: (4Fe-4S)-binding protein [Anaerolineae bacterium CG_4_9_14_3_um_filter_57_17]|nr:4Fe-4S dicluster domain-containing protein [bacterium]NCT19984.1 4Fe-4S dicluster domain-containing protein [bacterium]OIO84946.1 MAG: (4Fe-4S)-binding protein [Anaerolineae bacterium CG2_30_57_67]PJB64080.1 MAG: (4Fe-4S)-binding protein [Anaerolineae bacterium CG_4_9_14_3_um_filter_57_17]
MTNEATLLDKYASEVFAGLVSPALNGVQISAAPASDLTKEDALVRMTAELKRALEKPASERRWVMVIDLRKCVGCTACTIACVAENKLPPGVVYRPVLMEEIGTYPNVSMKFLPRPCMQCDEPPCVPVCPVSATFKRPDGIVAINYDECIGCRYCITACPYSARTFDAGRFYTSDTPQLESYETLPNFEYSESWDRSKGDSPIGNARKCQFCAHRLDAGMLPACVTTCIGRATYFGDANDPDSLVSELSASPNMMRLKEEMGTEPKVYYLV